MTVFQEPRMDFEQRLQQSMFSQTAEKTFIDKLLSRKDVEDIRTIVRKPSLSREDMLEVLYLIAGVESKLHNYGEWDRYLILKFFVWIREFCKVTEILFDYKEKLEKKEKDGSVVLSDRTKMTLDNVMKLMEHNIKFLLDLYLNISRSSLSIGATGFLEILKNKYEISYPSAGGLHPHEQKTGTAVVR